jgi:nucleoid-associated protein YgaU
MKKLIASVVLAAAPLALVSAPAEASGPPATCSSERWYPGPEYCDGHPWTISIRLECEQAKIYNPTWWKQDKICQSFVKKGHLKNRMYKIKKGDTLYSIARVQCGNPRLWRKIAAVNKITNVYTLKVGKLIILPCPSKVR